jgi:hypothetical protein
MTESLATRPSHTSVDLTVDGQHILLVTVDEDLTSTAIRLTPESAMKLGQILIDIATKVKQP